MHTENGVLIDVKEVRETVEQADVFAVAFRLFPERLIVDTRADAAELPMVAIVDPVATVEERFFWLGEHRPSLGMPQRFMFFFWPHSVGYLEESGVWGAVRERIVETGFEGAGETCDAALRDLLARERAANIDAIVGTRHETMWSAEREA